MASIDDDDTPPADLWDEGFAQLLLKARVLVGLTHQTGDGVFERQEQFFGVVVKVEQDQGIALALEGVRGGETYWLPPQTSIFETAKPGVYRLRSTGEEVIDPDYLVSWIVTQASEGPG